LIFTQLTLPGSSSFRTDFISSENIFSFGRAVENDVFCMHGRFDRSELGKIMQGKGVYVTIIRDPLSQFVSRWDFYGLSEKHKMTLDEFATRLPIRESRERQLLYDFGLEANKYTHRGVNRKIRELNATFSLVMIQEMFVESLVLLRRLLCWEMEDMAHVNLHSYKPRSSYLSSKGRHNLRKYLAADYKMYNFFVAKFRSLLRGEGKKFNIAEEVSHLKKTVRNAAQTCQIRMRTRRENVTSFYSALENAPLDCKLLAKEGGMLTRHVMNAQYERITGKKLQRSFWRVN